MQRSTRFSCPTGGLTAPSDLIRPRRGAHPRPIVAFEPFTGLGGVDADALDDGWTVSMMTISERSAA
jgi:hypothetical protein